MRLFVVRHAHAGARSDWTGDDRRRVLSERGCAESFRIATFLADAGVERLISSPLIRCVQTLEPVAGRLVLPIELDERLAPSATGREVQSLVKELCSGRNVICTHGEQFEPVLQPLVDAGMAVDDELRWPKGCIWELHGLDGDAPRGIFHDRPAIDW